MKKSFYDVKEWEEWRKQQEVLISWLCDTSYKERFKRNRKSEVRYRRRSSLIDENNVSIDVRLVR